MAHARNETELGGMVVIVAGGTGGIGRATCRLLGTHGATVIAAASQAGTLHDLSTERERSGSPALCLRYDLRYHRAWAELAGIVEQRFGRIDALVNCIGTLIPGPFERITPAEIERVARTNFLSILWGSSAVLPVMRRQRRGHIVNIGSLGGIVPMPFESLYSATKFAVRGFSLSLGEELRGSGLRVSLVSPGPVRTRMLDAESGDPRSTIPFAIRPLEAEEVAETIAGILRRPRPEVLLPRLSGKCARALTLFPGLTGSTLRLADIVGERKLRAYRRRYLAGAAAASSGEK